MEHQEKVYSDKSLRYVCPHCGKEQKFAEVEIRGGDVCAEDSWTYGTIMRFFEVVGPQWFPVAAPIPFFRCPSCKTMLRKKEIQKGFFEWLSRLRKKNPERYAEIIAELL
jgi:ssDNA-binding Zn-finger/Zn-ribbon topoisomerase 1